MLKCRLPGFVAVVAFAAALFVGANQVKAQVAPLPSTWQVSVKGDGAAAAAGRLDFVEFICCDATSFTGQEIARLGFATSSLTRTVNALGQTVVDCTMTSTPWGTVKFNATVDSTSLKGTMTWVQGTSTYSYTFSGVPYSPVEVES